MRRVTGLAVVALLVVGFAAFCGMASAERLVGSDHGGRPLTAMLTGAAEAPGPGNPDGNGWATITVNVGQSEVCWEINISGITLPATAAHIHVAPVGVPSPVVVPLSPPDASGFSGGCRVMAQDLVKAILQNPAAYYVNGHNTDFPGGAVRGQLSK